MCELPEYSDSENSSKPEGVSGIMPKVEDPYCEFPSLYTYTRPTGDNIASSSGSSVRSSLLAMGFNASLVDKAIEENGEDNIDLLLETLVANSDPPRAESSDSLDSLFGDDEDTNSSAKYDRDVHIKELPKNLPQRTLAQSFVERNDNLLLYASFSQETLGLKQRISLIVTNQLHWCISSTSNFLRGCFRRISPHVDKAIARYSVSALDLATTSFFFLVQDIRFPPIRKYPEVDLMSEGDPSQFASEYPILFACPLSSYNRPCPGEPLIYFKM